MISSTAGTEGESDVVYELGIFKTNGVRLTNATKADIVIDGIYGKGNGRQDGLRHGPPAAPDDHPGQPQRPLPACRTFEDTR